MKEIFLKERKRARNCYIWFVTFFILSIVMPYLIEFFFKVVFDTFLEHALASYNIYYRTLLPIGSGFLVLQGVTHIAIFQKFNNKTMHPKKRWQWIQFAINLVLIIIGTLIIGYFWTSLNAIYQSKDMVSPSLFPLFSYAIGAIVLAFVQVFITTPKGAWRSILFDPKIKSKGAVRHGH